MLLRCKFGRRQAEAARKLQLQQHRAGEAIRALLAGDFARKRHGYIAERLLRRLDEEVRLLYCLRARLFAPKERPIFIAAEGRCGAIAAAVGDNGAAVAVMAAQLLRVRRDKGDRLGGLLRGRLAEVDVLKVDEVQRRLEEAATKLLELLSGKMAPGLWWSLGGRCAACLQPLDKDKERYS